MTKKARVVLIDKPQPYRNRHATRSDNPDRQTRFGVGVAERYNHGVMAEEDLVRLGTHLKRIAAPDAYFFCWVTAPNIPFDCRLLGETGAPGLWGMEYKTRPFVWVKRYKNQDSQFKGGGSYNFSNTEDVWLARYPGQALWHPNNPEFKPENVLYDSDTTIEVYEPHQRYPLDPDDPEWDRLHPGAPPHTAHPVFPNTEEGRKDRRTCFRCHHVGKIVHSRKTEAVQDMIDAWLDPYLDGHLKVELFATREREGWVCLGGDLSGNSIFTDIELMEVNMIFGGGNN